MTTIRIAFLVVFLALGVYWLEHHTDIVRQHLGWSWPRQLRHEVGLFYGVLRYRLLRDSFGVGGGEQPWSRIGGPKGLVLLGPLPLQDFGDGEALVKLGVTHVFSLVEQFEREAGWLYTPVVNYGDSGKDHGSRVIVHWYNITDHAPLPEPATLVKWLSPLERAIDDGRLCYVHCRAGIGRSASLVVALLMHWEDMSFDEAHASVQRWRPQVSLNEAQKQALRIFGAWLDGRNYHHQWK